MRTSLFLLLTALLTFSQETRPSSEIAAELETAYRYRQEGRYKDAATTYELVLDKLRVSNATDKEIASVTSNLAGVYRKLSRYRASEQMYREALAIFNTLGASDATTILSNLALLYFDEARYAEAEDHYRRALAVYEKDDKPSANVAAILANFGLLLAMTGRLDEAEAVSRRALALRVQLFGNDHPDVARGLNDVATILYHRQQWPEARDLFEQALAGYERVFGANHREIPLILNNFAKLYRRTGHHDKAMALLERSLSITETTLGPSHAETAAVLANLGELYIDARKFREAEPLLYRALSIRESINGSEHFAVAETLVFVAKLHTERNNFIRAEPLLTRALTIMEKLGFLRHPQTAAIRYNLGELYRALGYGEKAGVQYLQAVKTYEECSPQSIELAVSLQGLAGFHVDGGRFRDAKALYRRALEILEKYPVGRSRVPANLTALGSIYIREKKYSEAEPLLQKAVSMLEESQPTNREELNTALESYAVLLRKTNRPNEANRLEERLQSAFRSPSRSSVN